MPYVGDPLLKPKRDCEVGLLVPLLIWVSRAVNTWLGVGVGASRPAWAWGFVGKHLDSCRERGWHVDLRPVFTKGWLLTYAVVWMGIRGVAWLLVAFIAMLTSVGSELDED